MTLLDLPAELLLDIGSLLSPEDLISLITTSKSIRSIFMIRVFGGTIHIRSPLPDFPDVYQILHYLREGMLGLQKCIDQVVFYLQHDLVRHVHTLRITNWTAPHPENFWLATCELAENKPTHQMYVEMLQDDNGYYLHALMTFFSIYEFIVLNLVQLMPLSELELVRSLITPNMHFTLTMMPTLRRLTLEDCTVARPHPTTSGTGGQYESFKATSEVASHLWDDTSTTASFIQGYLSLSSSTLTKLEICIKFLLDDALDHLSLPSLTYLAILPHPNLNPEMWSWGTVYRILKISPNITCFRFEPLNQSHKILYPFEEEDWMEYKRDIGDLPLSQLSSITAYRQLVKRLVPGRPVSFVKILLFPEKENRFINWPDPESDDEVNEALHNEYIVPHQLVGSTTPVKTLYLQRIDEQEDLKYPIWVTDADFLRDACPFVTDLWLSSLKLRHRTHRRDPVDAEFILEELMIWAELERCAIGPCSPWLAKELEWSREGTILPQRVHPTLQELLLDVDVLWKWHDDSEVTGWVLYTSTDIEGSEDSEEAIYQPGSRYADSEDAQDWDGQVWDDDGTDSDGTDSGTDSVWSSDG